MVGGGAAACLVIVVVFGFKACAMSLLSHASSRGRNKRVEQSLGVACSEFSTRAQSS